MPGSANTSPEGVMNRISWPFSLKGVLGRMPVMVSQSSASMSTISTKEWGWMPRWLPVKEQFFTGSMIQWMPRPTSCSSSRTMAVISAVSMP